MSKQKQAGFSTAMIIVALAVLVAAAVGIFVFKHKKVAAPEKTVISSYESCVGAGKPVMQTSPKQCAADGKTYTDPAAKPAAAAVPTTTESATTTTDKEETAIADAIIKDCKARGDVVEADVRTLVTENAKNANTFIRSGSFASISVACVAEPGNGFRSFLKKLSDSTWIVLGNTQDKTMNCKVLDGIGFPADIATTCFDTDGTERAIK